MSTRRQNPSAASGSNGAGSNNENASKKRALNGIKNTSEKTDSEFLCPVCFEVIIEAHITKCGMYSVS